MAKFKKGQSGNPAGRPKGIRDKRRALHLTIRNHGLGLVKKAVEVALSGDPAMLKFLLSQILPKDGLVELGPLSGELTKDGRRALRELGAGRLTPGEAASVLGALASQARLTEAEELERRVRALEERVQEGQP